MLQYVLAVCALGCPLSMVAMVWFMRGNSRRGSNE